MLNFIVACEKAVKKSHAYRTNVTFKPILKLLAAFVWEVIERCPSHREFCCITTS